MQPDELLDTLLELDSIKLGNFFQTAMNNRYHKLKYYTKLLKIISKYASNDKYQEILHYLEECLFIEPLIFLQHQGVLQKIPDDRKTYFDSTSPISGIQSMRKGSIEEAIFNDDIDTLQQIASNENFNFNELTKITFYHTEIIPNMPYIWFSAYCSAIRCFKFLLLNGARFEYTDIPKGIFYYAIAGGNQEIIQTLIESGAPQNSPAQAAIFFCQNSVLEWCLNEDTSAIKLNHVIASLNGFDYLTLSARNGNYNGVIFLVEQAKLNPNFQIATYHLTSLDFALARHDRDLFEYLLAHVNPADIKTNVTSIASAARFGFPECVEELLKVGAAPGQNAVSSVICLHRLDLFQELFEKGADPDFAGEDGNTPLMTAAEEGNTEVASELIERGCNIKQRDLNGFTALHYAAKSNSFEIAEILIERGALVNAQALDGDTPLHIASANDSYETAKILIESGADKMMRNLDGNTPYGVAFDTGSKKVRRLIGPWAIIYDSCNVQ